MAFNFNDRQTATIVAALTEWQNHMLGHAQHVNQQHPEAKHQTMMIKTTFGDHESLSGVEIQDLIKQLKAARLS